MRHLRSPGQFENVKDLICDFLVFREIKENCLSFKEIASQNECFGVVNAVPKEQGVCLGCLKGGFYCLRVFWGMLGGVSVLSELYGSAFYSNLIYVNSALIKSLTFSKRHGCPRCLKYQNVPTLRSF